MLIRLPEELVGNDVAVASNVIRSAGSTVYGVWLRQG